MKVVWLVLLVAASCVRPALAAESPVVVELFTSEGCSSCPPADALLVKLGQLSGTQVPDVIILGEHVDYWNHIGWTDRFSSPQFSLRQQGYAQHFGLASPYTPQMVIDGERQFVGNDSAQVAREITAAVKEEKPAKVSLTRLHGDAFQVSVRSSSAKGKVFLAVTEDSLSTEVKGGENNGRTLHHAGVVRELRTLGWLSNGSFDKQVEVPIKREWNPANLKLVVFTQQGDFRRILGAASLRLSQ
jgi:hypothetical protein